MESAPIVEQSCGSCAPCQVDAALVGCDNMNYTVDTMCPNLCGGGEVISDGMVIDGGYPVMDEGIVVDAPIDGGFAPAPAGGFGGFYGGGGGFVGGGGGGGGGLFGGSGLLGLAGLGLGVAGIVEATNDDDGGGNQIQSPAVP